MPRNTQKQTDDTREPDDMKEAERTAQVGRRDAGEYEDIEESRTKSSARRGKEEEELDEIDDADIVEEVDLDAAPEGDGPDA